MVKVADLYEVLTSLMGLQGHSLSTPCFTSETVFPPPKSVAMLQLIRPWIVGIRIIVEPFARLPPVPPGHHQALQQRRGSEPPLLKLVIHHVSNVISRIDPNEIEQSERPHGISTSTFHSVINILDRSHALFLSADGIEQIRHQQPVHNESSFVGRAPRNFAQLLSKLVRHVVNVVGGGYCPHH